MCLSRVYNSHSSFINRIAVATVTDNKKKKKFVFVTAYGDETLAQY